MTEEAIDHRPDVFATQSGDSLHFLLTGDWTLAASRALEEKAGDLSTLSRGERRAVFDFSQIGRLDTAGAWLIDGARRRLIDLGVAVTLREAQPEHETLLREAHHREFRMAPAERGETIVDILANLGRSVCSAGHEFLRGVSFLGEVVAGLGSLLARPKQFRATSVVYHIEAFGFYSIPIIVLINLLVGAIVAQQGIFQLQRFGAVSYNVNLIGILVLREMGVLLTSIMVAGRSGSAITAELGSMKMREEIDALRVMGLSPIMVLIVPRILALIIALPILTFIGDMAALFGGLVVSWVYGGVSPNAFLALLQNAIGRNTFFVGLVKAPFMAATIGIIASMDGLATGGSAESLGRQVTASVVKSIFMVIVIDGLFAIFFAAINY